MDGDLRYAGGEQGGLRSRVDDRARPGDDVGRGDVVAEAPDVAAARHGVHGDLRRQRAGAGRGIGVLDRDHGEPVELAGDRRAGHDPHGGTRLRALRAAAGGDFAGHSQGDRGIKLFHRDLFCLNSRKVGGVDQIAVHRGVGKRRDGQARLDIGG